MYKVEVKVTYKESVVDPQGKAIKAALDAQDYAGINKVSQGKYFVIDVEAASKEEAEAKASEIAEKLLVNPEMEDFAVKAMEADA